MRYNDQLGRVNKYFLIINIHFYNFYKLKSHHKLNIQADTFDKLSYLSCSTYPTHMIGSQKEKSKNSIQENSFDKILRYKIARSYIISISSLKKLDLQHKIYTHLFVLNTNYIHHHLRKIPQDMTNKH